MCTNSAKFIIAIHCHLVNHFFSFFNKILNYLFYAAFQLRSCCLNILLGKDCTDHCNTINSTTRKLFYIILCNSSYSNNRNINFSTDFFQHTVFYFPCVCFCSCLKHRSNSQIICPHAFQLIRPALLSVQRRL